MALVKEKVAELKQKFGKTPNDSGSPEVQVALLTERIKQLSKHFETHRNDLLPRRNFLKLIGQRKRLLKYLKNRDLAKYEKLVKDLGL